MGITARPIGKTRSIMKKLENQLAKEEAQVKEVKNNKKEKNQK